MEYIKSRKLEKQVGLAFYPVNSLLAPIMSMQTVYTLLSTSLENSRRKARRTEEEGVGKEVLTGRRDKKEKGRGEM